MMLTMELMLKLKVMKNRKVLTGLICLILLMMVGGGYHLMNKGTDLEELEELYGPIRNENFFRMTSIDTLSSTKVFLNEDEWELDTIYMVDGKMLYVGYGSFSRTIVIYSDKGLLVEDPTLNCPWHCDEIFERCLISSIGKKLWLDFKDSASVAQLASWGKVHPDISRFRKDTLADFGRMVLLSLTVDFPKKSHEKTKEIDEWLMNIGYEYLDCEERLSLLNNKKQWVDVLARTYFRSEYREYAENDWEYPCSIYNVLDLRARTLTDKYATYQKYTHGYSGGAHGYYTERLVSYDFIHQEEINWNYLFKEQCEEDVWKLLCKVVYEDEKYRKCWENEDLKKVRWRLNEAHKEIDEMEVGLGETGVVFSYQPYEIGGFADGTFHFNIPYQELMPYLTDKAKWCLK